VVPYHVVLVALVLRQSFVLCPFPVLGSIPQTNQEIGAQWSLAATESTTIYANAEPSGTRQATVYTTNKATALAIFWKVI